MAVSKKQRLLILQKTNGRCGYCGTELGDKFHVDHMAPVRRHQEWDYDKEAWVYTGKVEHPERETIDNYMAACASCNINKHSMTIEEFRKQIVGFMKHLNEISTQYKIAKRYGLVVEDIKPIVFYYETLQTEIRV